MAFVLTLKFPELPRTLRGNVPRQIINSEARKGIARGSTVMLKTARRFSPKVTKSLSQSWERKKIRRIRGGWEGGVQSDHHAAFQFEKGRTRKHRPPSDPISTWIRRKSGVAFFTFDRKGDKVPANLGNDRTVGRIAFTIARAIENRGNHLPSPQALSAVGGKKLWERSFKRDRRKIEAEVNKIIPNIIRRLEA